MSYDVTLELSGGTDETAEVFWRNHTSNTARMWREAGCDLAEFHRGRAADLAASLRPALADIKDRREHYAKMNPPNGWGSVDTTIEFLRDILTACEDFPAATVDVCS